jgi:hypothetical protein
MGSLNSEFSIYESIIHGELRPFLPENSPNIQSEKKINKPVEDKPIENHFKILQSINITPKPKVWIPPARDPKAEHFLSMIEKEFDEIKKRAEKLLNEEKKEKKISLFANQNIKEAKKLAIDSGHLSRSLNSENKTIFEDPDLYIICIVGRFLIRSILHYQNLFEPYLKNPIETEDELCAYVNNPYVFSHKGDYWKINFNGEEALIKDLERVRYIVHLLDNPQREIYCHELMALVKGLNPEIDPNYSKMGRDKLEEENLSLVDLKIENLSPDDKDNIENVAYATWERTRDSSLSPSMKENAKKEWDRVRGHLLNEHGVMVAASKKGLSFKLKVRLKPEFEKARSNVTKHIKSAIKGIEKIIPSLSGHLNNAIDTGAKCCYRPDPSNPIKWSILWNN